MKVTSVAHPPRRVPQAIRVKLQDELESMEKSGVIIKVTDPTDSLVVVEKSNGKFIVCIDSKELNTAIKRPLPHANT